MKAAESRLGYFFLADISGFTAYLVGVELEHAGDILNELLEYVTGQIKPLFMPVLATWVIRSDLRGIMLLCTNLRE